MQLPSRLEQDRRLNGVVAAAQRAARIIRPGKVRVLADRCSHMSGPLSDGELADGC